MPLPLNRLRAVAPGHRSAFRCHSAVVDPLGNVVVLREGRSDAGPSAFGWLHTLLDHNVADHNVERVWVEADPSPSGEAPDGERFGVVTAYCKLPYNANPENKCLDWVNESLL